MTKLSFWAKYHPRKARLIIIALHVLLNVLAIYTGIALLQIQLMLPTAAAYFTVLVFFSAVFFYPRAGSSYRSVSKNHRYIIRKTCDVALAACSFILVCFLANYWYANPLPLSSGNAFAAVSVKPGKGPTAEEILASLQYRDKHSLTRAEKRILKNEFRQQLKIYVKAKIAHDDEAGAKALFIILSIIGAIGLTILLAGLACNIACNGSEAAAVILMILGVTGIVFLLLAVIKKIKSHKKHEKDPATEVKPAP